MSIGLTAAIYGAFFGALANGIIELIKYFHKKKSLIKSIKVVLYYEINNHQIYEEGNDQNNQPNFYLKRFYSDFL